MVQIIEENEFFIVLLKPASVSVHNEKPSLVEYLTENKKPLHFVNRLDSETSGLMLIAQKPEFHAKLSHSLEAGQKIYRALLRSPWKSNLKQQTLDWPLSDKAEGRMNPQGLTKDRKQSITKIEILRSNKYFTEIKAEILTGRQHQIRKHCALLKHPIVGDQRYNEKKYNTQIEKFYSQSRMHLHAEELHFIFRNKPYLFLNIYNLDLFFKD